MIEYQTFKTREEWLQARGNTIGGSDASAILGINPYMNNVQLWEVKTGRRQNEDISQEPLVLYGTMAEEYLRELYKLDHPKQTVLYEPNNMWRNTAYPFAHASLDGWIVEGNRNGIFENKTVTMNSAAQRAKWSANMVPPNYYAQILHYLLVTGYDFAVLKAQIKYERDGDLYAITRHYRVERSEVQTDIDYLAEREEEFYMYIKADKCPPLILPKI